jgi:hypothetical protein
MKTAPGVEPLDVNIKSCSSTVPLSPSSPTLIRTLGFLWPHVSAHSAVAISNNSKMGCGLLDVLEFVSVSG